MEMVTKLLAGSPPDQKSSGSNEMNCPWVKKPGKPNVMYMFDTLGELFIVLSGEAALGMLENPLRHG